jgi:hypothetical protein
MAEMETSLNQNNDHQQLNQTINPTMCKLTPLAAKPRQINAIVSSHCRLCNNLKDNKFPCRPSNELRELRKVALLEEQEHGTKEGNRKEEDRKKPATWFCAMESATSVERKDGG